MLDRIVVDVPLDVETHTTPPHAGALSLHTQTAVVALRLDPDMPHLDAASILTRLISQATVLRDQYLVKAGVEIPTQRSGDEMDPEVAERIRAAVMREAGELL